MYHSRCKSSGPGAGLFTFSLRRPQLCESNADEINRQRGAEYYPPQVLPGPPRRGAEQLQAVVVVVRYLYLGRGGGGGFHSGVVDGAAAPAAPYCSLADYRGWMGGALQGSAPPPCIVDVPAHQHKRNPEAKGQQHPGQQPAKQSFHKAAARQLSACRSKLKNLLQLTQAADFVGDAGIVPAFIRVEIYLVDTGIIGPQHVAFKVVAYHQALGRGGPGTLQGVGKHARVG